MYKYLSLVLLLCGAVFSNECPMEFGSNDRIVGVHATNISMREEEIIITLRKNYYEVDVSFDFYNNGEAKKVLLGFPVKYWFSRRDTDKETYDFNSYINGEIIPKYTIRWDSTGPENFTKWFIRDVTFSANSRTTSRVTYKATYQNCGGPEVAGYVYGTGRFWKDGTIGKMTVIINHGDDVLVDRINFGKINNLNIKPSEFIWEANGKYKYIFKNVKPQNPPDNILSMYQPFDIYGEYDDEFGVKPRNGRGYHINNYHYDYWWAWDEHLLYKKPTDIQHYTKNQIRLFINFFSAIHGYDFKNPLYKEYFQKIETFGDKNNTEYKVNPNFSENDFNEIERKNVNYLLNLEKKIPAGQ
jgi:hypothetical protein